MSLPRYPKYKDSGVEWLGEVPEHWQVKPLKYMASLKGRLGWQGLRSDEYTDDGPFLVTSEHLSNDKVDWNRCYHVLQDRYELAPEIQLREGDLLMMKDGAAMGKLGFIDELPGPACLNSHLLLFRPLAGAFENRFLYFVLGGPGFNCFMVQERTGTTFFGISQESIGSFPLATPPQSEQHKILRFLNKETAKIDELVEEQRRLIELLKEKRQAVISHAVTKGLDSDAPMKDSGIEWLGEVPAHWESMQLRRLVTSIEQGWSPQAEEREPDGDEWGVLKLNAVKAGRFDASKAKALFAESVIPEGILVKPGDLLLTRANTPELVGDSCCVDEVKSRLIFSDLIYRINLEPSRVTGRFMNLVLQSPIGRSQIEADARGSSRSMVKVSHEHILSWMTPVPPVSEQEQIVRAVEQAVNQIDSLLGEASHGIDLLHGACQQV